LKKGKLHFHAEMKALNGPQAFQALCRRAAKVKWVVFAKAPFGSPEQVLKYLARYTHRVAISNSRIRSIRPFAMVYTCHTSLSERTSPLRVFTSW
jgi:hypothetical protein